MSESNKREIIRINEQSLWGMLVDLSPNSSFSKSSKQQSPDPFNVKEIRCLFVPTYIVKIINQNKVWKIPKDVNFAILLLLRENYKSINKNFLHSHFLGI